MGLDDRQGALLEHFAQQQAWHRFAHGIKMFQSGPGAHPSVQVRRLDLAVLLCPEQAWGPILDFRSSQTFIGQGDHPDGFRRECRPSGPGGVLRFVPAGSSLGFQRANDSKLAQLQGMGQTSVQDVGLVGAELILLNKFFDDQSRVGA